MYFYKDANNLFHIDQSILPPGNYILNVYQFEAVVDVESADTHTLTMGATLISELQKENGSYYISLAELLYLNAEFFSMVTNEAAAGDHDVLVNVRMAALGVTQGHINDQAQTIAGNKKFSNQAHAGDHLASFSAIQLFDADDGTIQEMPITSDTAIEIENEQAGTYVFWLMVTSGTPTITIGSSFGTPVTNTGTLINADGDINIITLIVSPSGVKKYTITN